MYGPGTCEWESDEVGMSAACGNGRGGGIEICWDDRRVCGVGSWIIEAGCRRTGVVWVLLPAAIFWYGGMTAEEATVDGGDCVGIKFDALRPEEVGRRARLGVLEITFCSELRGGRDGGFERVEFSEALLLTRVEDIFLS